MRRIRSLRVRGARGSKSSEFLKDPRGNITRATGCWQRSLFPLEQFGDGRSYGAGDLARRGSQSIARRSAGRGWRSRQRPLIRGPVDNIHRDPNPPSPPRGCGPAGRRAVSERLHRSRQVVDLRRELRGGAPREGRCEPPAQSHKTALRGTNSPWQPEPPGDSLQNRL